MIDTMLLRQKILDLAIQGKLVPQNPGDEPASVLIEKIRNEKVALVKAGKIKAPKHNSFIFRGEDNRYYENIDGKVTDISDQIPFDIPYGWEWCRLDNMSTILYGISESAKSSGLFKLLRITDIQDNNVDWNTVPLTDYSGDATQYQLKPMDILFARTGATVGKSYLVEETPQDAVYASYLIRVRLFLPQTGYYIKAFFGSGNYWNQIIDKSLGTGQPNVNGTSLGSLLLPVPPFSEQQRIVSCIGQLFAFCDTLDKADADLESTVSLARQKVLDLAIRGQLVPQNPADEPASELLKRIQAEKAAQMKPGKRRADKRGSTIIRGGDNRYYENVNGKATDITDQIPFEIPLSWEWVRLHSLGYIVGGGTPDTTNKSYWDNGSIAWLSPADLTGYSDMYISHGEKNITHEGLTHSSARLMPAGSILYSSRAPIGYVVISRNEISTNQGFKSLVPYKELNNRFYYYVLRAITPDIVSRATGTTFKEISGTEFGETLVPLPPLTEQKRIVLRIQELIELLDILK